MPPREKENAKEWQIKEAAGVHKGNVYTYVNGWVDEDQTSESASEGLAPPQAAQPNGNSGPRFRPPQLDCNQFQKVSPKKPTGRPKPKQAITFAAKRDNAAKVAFRTNQPPSASYDLCSPLVTLEPSVARLHRTLEEIGVRFGSFILPHRAPTVSKMLIWGNKQQIDDTIAELKQWRHHRRGLTAVRESRAPIKESFARITSMIGIIHAAEEKTAKRDAARQLYQQAPLQGQRFKFNGYFLWPNSEIRAVDLFGPNCEALDSLRIEHRAHISFDEARSVFKIHSDRGADRVHQVIQCIESTIKEYVARDHRPATLLLVDALASVDGRHGVRIVDGPLLGVNRALSKIPVLCEGKTGGRKAASLQQEAKKLGSRNQSRTYTAAQRVLERLPYYRGHLRMRVNFGTFALVKFQWPPGVPFVTLEKFMADVQSAGTKGTLIRNLRSSRTPQAILDCCYEAGDLFEAVGTNEQSLAKSPPQYTAMFYLRHPAKSDEMVQLEVIFKSNAAEGEGFESSKARWTRGGKPDAVSQAPPLEAFHIRLHSGVSWQLKISAENSIDQTRITPLMEEFANGVKCNVPPPGVCPAISGYKVFTNPPNLPILGMEQKTTFRYCLKAQPSCNFELSRYDEYNGENPRYPSSTQWAASFYDREWDVKLSENASLGIGQSASWDPHANPFFRPMHGSTSKRPHAGFTDFLHHVQAISSFLDNVKGISPQPAETEGGPDESSRDSDIGNVMTPDQTTETEIKASEARHEGHSDIEITPDQLDLFERASFGD